MSTINKTKKKNRTTNYKNLGNNISIFLSSYVNVKNI